MHAPLSQELTLAFERVTAAGDFILGDEVQRFEDAFAAYCGVEHCVGVSSGTAALTVALRSAGIGAGDEVVVPAHTYIASALGALNTGARPVFCDVDRATGLIDPAAAAAAITERTAAIMAVHLYGQPCDMRGLRALAADKGLLLLEDAAQAHGAVHDGRRAGGLGTVAAFSFYPSKNLGALGDGGAICTDDVVIAERARELRNLGQRGKGEHVVAGANERLDGMQAAFLSVKLPYLDGWNATRRALAERYRELLPADLELLTEAPGRECVFHLYPVRADDRDALAARLSAQGVQTGVHYHPSVPAQPPFAHLADGGDFPAAVAWAQEELSLPMGPSLTERDIARVAAACGA